MIILGLVMKCTECGAVCTDDYLQLTRRRGKQSEVIGIFCSTKCAVRNAGATI